MNRFTWWLLCLFVFLTGAAGLVYQVVWVREFGNVFGATIYSTSLVVAIFMLGLGSGSCLVGRWADRRYLHAPESLLRAYGLVEFLIAGLGLAISLVLPHLHALAALSSAYVVDSAGWFVLSPRSYAAQGAIALGLLGPITMLMGGTLRTTLYASPLAPEDDRPSRAVAAVEAVLRGQG